MATFVASIADFSLSSTWVVRQYPYGHPQAYQLYISSPPTTAEANKSFSFAGIPAGSVINSATLTATLGSPLSGAAIRTVDGVSFSGSLSVTAQVGGSKAFEFRFKANGNATTTGNRSSSQTFSNVKITVTYTPPYTAPSVSNVTLAGGTGNLYAGAGTGSHVLAWTGTNGSYNAISKYLVYRSINGADYALLSDQTATSLNVTAPATAGEHHRYYIVAVGGYSNSASAYSPYLYAYKAPGAPTGVGLSPATVYTSETTRVSWVAGAAGTGVSTSKYEVYRAGVLVGSATGLYLDVTAPATAGNYTYTVRAIGSISGYNSALSAEASLTVENPASTGSLDRSSVAMDGTSTIKIIIASGNAAFTHKAVWKAGSASVTQNVAAGVASTTLTVPLAWCAQFPSAISGTASVVLETYNGAAKTGERTYTFTVTVPASVVPSFTALTASIVANGIAITNRYVQGYSSVALAITSPAGAQGSTISNYSITGGGFTAAATQTTTFGKLNAAGTITFTGTITDSRGRTASKTVSITVQPYSAPSLSGVLAYRCNVSGTKEANGLYVLLRATNVIASVDGQNTATLEGRVYMKGATPGAWQAMSSNANLITGAGGILIIKSYTAQIRITDKIGNYVYTATIPTDSILFHGLDNVAGAAIGKYAETPNALEIPEDWSFRRGAYVGLDSGNYGGHVTPAGIGAAASSHNHIQLYAKTDNRSVATAPDDYNSYFTVAGLKRSSTVGTPMTGTYVGIIGWRQWSDSSGGPATELAFGDEGIAFRQGATTTWGSWLRLIHSGNYNSYAPTLTGTGASGTWGISITGNADTASTATKLTTARTLTIGSTGKTFNGSANVSWTLAEIGAQKTITSGTAAPSGGSSGDIYIQYV